MLLNPCTYPISKHLIEGTRALDEHFILNQYFLGVQVEDPLDAPRKWTITTFFAPIKGRRIGGVRARLVDQKGFVTFCNQRDLEVLLGIVKPGQWCEWLGTLYPRTSDREFYGLCMDSDDLSDDLLVRECEARIYCSSHNTLESGCLLPSGIELRRRIHTDPLIDDEEFVVFLHDRNPTTGMGPDPSLNNILSRWKKIERRRVVWSQL